MRSALLFSFLFATLCATSLLGCADAHETGTDSALSDGGLPIDGGPGMCPASPVTPNTACSSEGLSCNYGGSDVCGSALSCTCRAGQWQCGIAEADPVCWCGRQPAIGDRCNGSVPSCGECCPTPGGTGWPAMVCVDGHWQPSACPPVVCPTVPVECPADTAAALGTACAQPGQTCGDACCDSAIVCEGGVWRPGPVADCFACTQYACGTGACPSSQTCLSRCGPADGIELVCVPRDGTCNDCGCIPLSPTQRCEMIDGHPHVSETGFCG
jgi:hypothetical protein